MSRQWFATVLVGGLLGLSQQASAQFVVAPVVSYYAPAPAVSYYVPAPVPAVSYYAPAPVVSYYAPAPAVSYYAPAPVAVAPAPVAVAPVASYYVAPATVGYGLFGRTIVRTPYVKYKY